MLMSYFMKVKLLCFLLLTPHNFLRRPYPTTSRWFLHHHHLFWGTNHSFHFNSFRWLNFFVLGSRFVDSLFASVKGFIDGFLLTVLTSFTIFTIVWFFAFCVEAFLENSTIFMAFFFPIFALTLLFLRLWFLTNWVQIVHLVIITWFQRFNHIFMNYWIFCSVLEYKILTDFYLV